jgi:geranylgeranyl pyrophosphate synthase
MEAIKSLEKFPQSEAKLALESLASIAVNRKK